MLPPTIEQTLIGGDLSRLQPEQRLELYKAVCSSLSLNPLTKPFAYIQLNGKLTLYALKDCTDQLRTIHGISISILSREVIEGVYVVTAHAQRPDGRHDESTGAVPIDGVKGETRANALMKAETKAKRRATLSICGLGMLDESEVDSIKGAQRVDYPETVAAAERRFDADMAKQHKLSMSEKKQIAQAEAIVSPVAPLSMPEAMPRRDAVVAAESQGLIHPPPQAATITTKLLEFKGAAVPEELSVLIQGILDGKKSYVRDGLGLMKKRLGEVDPEMGAAIYRDLVEKHHLRVGKPDPSAVAAAILDMWAAANRPGPVVHAPPEFTATDSDLPDGLFIASLQEDVAYGTD